MSIPKPKVPERSGRYLHTPPQGVAAKKPARLQSGSAAGNTRPVSKELEQRSVLDLIRLVKDGRVNPRLLGPDDRRACVAHLCGEGLFVPEIAQFLKCSDRTVTRDRRAIQDAAALDYDPALAGRIAGQLVAEATHCVERIRRVSRDRATPPAIKVDAEHKCFDILCSLTQRLQSLGFLPTATQRHEADITHHQSDLPDLDQIQREVQRLRDLGVEILPADAPELAELAELDSAARNAGLATRVARCAASLPVGGDPGTSG